MTRSSSNSEIAQAFASYLPPALARRVWMDPRSSNRPHADEFPAAVLFADITGFTDLNERLTVADAHAVEELTSLLNRYFTGMIEILLEEGGEVVQFSGDALTAVFAADSEGMGAADASGLDPAGEEGGLSASVARAKQAAQRMQQATADFTDLPSNLDQANLGMSIIIGAGLTTSLFVGGLNGQWQYIIAGEPLRQIAAVTKSAEPGEVVLSPHAQLHSIEEVLPGQTHPQLDWERVTAETVEVLRSHLPDIVSHRLMAGQSQWLSELRSLSILFFGTGEMDCSLPGVLDRVQSWVEAFQQIVFRYEGSLNKLLVDDKGTVGVVLFGAPPHSHEDDALRAVRCALDLRQEARKRELPIAIGLTTGQVFAGSVGSDSRREYTVIGDPVNLATRLMQHAGPGNIRADFATYQATLGSIEWEALLPQTVKGKAAAVRIYRPLGLHEGRSVPELRAPLVGRAAEMQAINDAFDRLVKGHAQVICLEGDAGIGKSALVRAVASRTRREGLVGLLGNGDALEQKTPYNAWREIFRSYFDLETVTDSSGQQVKINERLSDVAPELRERVALLNDLLGLELPETSLTTNFIPRLRQASLTALLMELLALWARESPLVLVLEDAQWLDSLSWRLALQVARGLSELPILLVLALRPMAELAIDHPYTAIRHLDHCSPIVLEEMDREETASLVASELGVDELPLEVGNFIAERSAGNPFVAQELARTLLTNSAIRVVNRQCMLAGPLGNLQLPDTVHGLVLSRIDRLPAREQLILKVASIIGRTLGFATLRELLAQRIDDEEISASLQALTQMELLRALESPTALRSHAFSQAIIQEVTYGTLLRSQRRELHQAAASWYEKYAYSPDYYSILAHHWRMAERPERELGYAILACQKLAADYANSEALSFLDRALQLSDDNQDQYELLMLRWEIHRRIGDRLAQEEDLQRLQALVNQPEDHERQAEVGNVWAEYYRNVSEYSSAKVALRYARRASRQAHDQTSEARSMTIWGQVLEHQGAYTEAKDYFEQALDRCQKLGDHNGEADNLNRLSNVARYLGDNHKALQYALEALQIRRNIGDRAKEALSLYNLGLITLELGEIDRAASFRQQALEIAQAIGDRASEAMSLSAIGQGHLIKGDYAAAQRYLQQALRLYQVMGERRSEANCLNLLGMVWRDVGNDRNAQRSFEQALAIQEEIGSHSFSAYTYLNLGLVNLQLNTPMAHVCYEKALERAKDTGNRDAEAYALSYCGGYYEHERRWNEAAQHYEKALAIRKELQATAASIEDTAGLARIALVRGEVKVALQHASACLEFVTERGVEGMEFPLQVYITCVDVLDATGDPDKAKDVLQDAHDLLEARARAISDPIMRDGMLQNVAINQRVLSEWTQKLG